MSTPLQVKLGEIDLVESYAWWLVEQVGVNTESAWEYVGTVNAWHQRFCGIGLAAGFTMKKVQSFLHGYQRLQGEPIKRRKRIGVRPAHLSMAIKASYGTQSNALQMNYSACFECALAGIVRAGELVTGFPRGLWKKGRHPSRADVHFREVDGVPMECVIYTVNSKAKGEQSMIKVPIRLPMQGRFLSPGMALWQLTRHVDPVPEDKRNSTPLFRDPSTGKSLTVKQIREELRRLMNIIGRDGSMYGAHSLRIGGATALSFSGAPPHIIKTMGRWRSDAYLRYLRDCKSDFNYYSRCIIDANVDDYEADEQAFEAADLDEEDWE